MRPHQLTCCSGKKKNEKQISMGKMSQVGNSRLYTQKEKGRQKGRQSYRGLRVGPQLHLSIMHIYKMESTTSVLPK